jgi:hypothetical protein
MHHPLRLFVVVLAALAGPSHGADVGRVLLAAGDAVAVRGEQTIKLTYGVTLRDRDVLRTGPASHLQVRFADESIISIREMSELRIDEFRFTGKEDGTERAFFSLLKGGLRAITGFIGRSSHDNYRMSTTTATIGIRGTDYAARLCQKDCTRSDGTSARDGLYGRVLGPSHGTNRIDVANDADRKIFGKNENFYVADMKSRIESLLAPPDFVSSRLEGRKHGGAGTTGGSGNEQATVGGAAQDSRGSASAPPPLEPLLFVSTEDLGTPGTPAVLGGTIPGVGNGVVAYSIVGSMTSTLDLIPNAVLAADSQNRLSAFNAANLSGTLGGGSVTDVGSNPAAGNLHWGRWTGSGVTVTTTSVPLDVSSLHYIVGNVPTLPAAGAFTYSPIGGTAPVNNDGLTGNFLGGTVTVNFSPGNESLNLNNWQIAFNGATYSQSGAATAIWLPGASTFRNNASTPLNWSCANSNCGIATVGGIAGDFRGSFAGVNAPGMGIVYSVQDSGVNGVITGAQGFKR